MDKFRNKRILSLTAAAALAMGCLLLFGSLAWNLEKRERMLLGFMSAQAPEQAGEFLDEINRRDFYYQAGRELENVMVIMLSTGLRLYWLADIFSCSAFFQVLPAFCAFWLSGAVMCAAAGWRTSIRS